METKMKGLLRGLRYISQIFDNKEQEMQIGYPTDVKHVAHIGWDGPSAGAAAPSWMNEFQSAPATNGEGGADSASGEQQPPGRQSRRNSSSEGPAGAGAGAGASGDSPKRGARQSRRHQSAGNVSVVDSPSRDSSLPEGSRRGRRHRTAGGGGGSGSSESAASLDETPAVPKQSRRRKPKGSSSSSGGGSGGGSTQSGRSKAAPTSHSDPGIDNHSDDQPAPLSPTREEDGF